MTTLSKNTTLDLEALIFSMSKSEKRFFKLDQLGGSDSGQLKYVKLFDSIVRHSGFKEELLLRDPDFKKSQLPNLKSTLYNHLLRSLRSLAHRAEPEMQVRTLIDHSGILFDRGLYHQSEAMLEKALKLADKLNMPQMRYEILYRERIIELQLTRSLSPDQARNTRIAGEASAEKQSRIAAFSGLILELHAYYIQNGPVSNAKEFEDLRTYCESQLPNFNLDDLGLYERIYFYRARTWFYFVTQDFPMCHRYFSQAISLMKEHHIEKSRPILFLKLYNGWLNTLLHMNKRDLFDQQFAALQSLSSSPEFQKRKGVSVMLERYIVHHKINRYFLFGEFDKGCAEIPQIVEDLDQQTIPHEPRYLISTLYKMACLYFGNAQHEECLRLIDRIIYLEDNTYQKDIHKFARILKLASLYELQHLDDLFEHLVATYHFLLRNKDMNLFQQEIMSFLRRIANSKPEDTRAEFVRLKAKMIEISKEPFEKRPFFYFDIISWLESNITGQPVASIIQQRGLGHGNAK